jgi:SAM-dependent methyltransferase
MSGHPTSPYFYAGAEADLYDLTVRLTGEAYDSVHDIVCELACRSLSRLEPVGSTELVLDLGCGTGEEAFRLLRARPACRILAVDSSADMLRLCMAKARLEFGAQAAAERLITVHVDLRDKDWLPTALMTAPSYGMPKVVVSVYALHHMLPDEKAALYRDLAQLLTAGSSFVNGDVFSYASQWAAELAQQDEEQWIQQSFQDERNWRGPDLEGALGRRDELLRAWLAHVRTENVPLPIHAPSRAHPRASWNETDALADAGFSSTECFYRFYQSGVVMAVK